MMKALIIEDSPPFAKSLKALLDSNDFQATVASSWPAARSLLAKKPYQVVFIDILLPEVSGMAVLGKIIDQGFAPNSHFILMSGIFDEKSVQKKLPNIPPERVSFLKKPFNESLVLQALKSVREDQTSTSFGFEKTGDSKKNLLNVWRKKTFYGHELLKLLFQAHHSEFEGELKIRTSEEESAVIQIKKGSVLNVVSKVRESLFGVLLLEHGFSLKEELLKALNQNDRNVPIGRWLVERGLLSPHLVDFILKEQIKVRLGHLASSVSFCVEAVERSVEWSKGSEVDFRKMDLMEWGVDCVQTKIPEWWLESFFEKNKQDFIYPLTDIKAPLNCSFIKNCQSLFERAGENLTLKNLLDSFSAGASSQGSTAQERAFVLKMVYFGLVIGSLRKVTKRKADENSGRVKAAVNQILQTEDGDLFRTLSLPEEASISEVEARYRQIVRMIHPDRQSPDISSDLKDRCQSAFVKATEVYSILKDQEKRSLYLKKRKEGVFLSVISVYENGLSALKDKNYTEALKSFTKILNKPQAPGNTILYALWAEIKADPLILKEKDRAGDVRRRINFIPIEEKASWLFWFVKGLYSLYTGDPENAVLLFNKTLQIKKDFKPAWTERIKATKQFKKSAGNFGLDGKFSLFKFFKKTG